MLRSRVLRVLYVAVFIALFPAQPANAGRTAIDGGSTLVFSGYCSPKSADTAGCAPYALASPINIAGTAYNSFFVNSNGTVSLGSIEPLLAPENTNSFTVQTDLTAYAPTPVFSPRFVDGPGFFDFFGGGGYDGAFVSKTTQSATGFNVLFYGCSDPLSCGPTTVSIVQSASFSQQSYDNFGLSRTIANSSQLNDPNATPEQKFASGKAYLLSIYPNTLPIYSLTLTQLASGFQVDFGYNPAAANLVGTYGFALPTGQLQETGALQNRSFVFDANGALVAAVPEPSTWLTMLLGFAGIGVAMRRRRRLSQALA